MMSTYDRTSAVDRVKATDEALRHYYGAENWLTVRRKLQPGIGLGVSVLIDATVVRSVLLPATMKLLGDWNWYLSKWLDWLPKVSVREGQEGNQPILEGGYSSHQSTPCCGPSSHRRIARENPLCT